MTTRRASLFSVPAPEAAAAVASAPAAPAASVEEKSKSSRPATRIGKRAATTYIDPAAWKQVQMIAIDEDTSVEALLREGLNAVFAARNLTRLA